MSLEVSPYADRRRQPSVVVVAGTPERLRYISSTGEYREGEPEAIWKELAQPEKYLGFTTVRGKQYSRWNKGSPPIVVAAKRGSIRELVQTCDARHWSGVRSDHGKYKTIVHDGEGGPIVRRLGVTADLEVAADALFTFVRFCNDKGVRFGGSVAGAGFNLFRTTLTQPIRFWSPPNITEALWPGRREYFYPPDRYFDMAYYDIKAAYPYALIDDRTMFQRGVPTHWKYVENEGHSERLLTMGNLDGYGTCTVYVPPDNPPPNPVPLRLKPGTRRESITYATGAFSGVWPFRDIAHAWEANQMVRQPSGCWIPSRYTDAFASDAWQALRKELRSLPGLAGTLGKLADNSLWGMFAFDNTADAEIRWLTKDGDPTKISEKRKPGIRRVHGAGVGVIATARVRDRLWDGINSTKAVYCDTDGLIAPYATAPQYMNGKRKKNEGEWALKERFGVLDIKAPQVYRWANEGDVDWHYLGESMPHTFHSFGTEPNRPNGDDRGNAGAMSVRLAHLRGLMNDDV